MLRPGRKFGSGRVMLQHSNTPMTPTVRLLHKRVVSEKLLFVCRILVGQAVTPKQLKVAGLRKNPTKTWQIVGTCDPWLLPALASPIAIPNPYTLAQWTDLSQLNNHVQGSS